MGIIGSITAGQIIDLRQKGHVVAIYPRKRECRVDGFKQYSIPAQEWSTLKRCGITR